MSFSEYSNLEAKNVTQIKLCHSRDKWSNYNLQQTETRKQSYLDGFMQDI